MNQYNNLPQEIYISVGFLIPASISEELTSMTQRACDLRIMSNSPGNTHVTLLSLGKTFTSTLEPLTTIVENIATRVQPMTFKNGRLIIVEPDKPERIWIRYDSNPWYENLVSTLEEACWKIGTWRFKRDRKGRKSSGKKITQPHITIAKTKDGLFLPSIVPPFELPVQFSSIYLDTVCIFRVENDQLGNHIYTPLWSIQLEK